MPKKKPAPPAPSAPMRLETTLDALEVLFMGGPYFPLRRGDVISVTGELEGESVLFATVRMVGSAAIVSQVGERTGAASRAARVQRFLAKRVEEAKAGTLRAPPLYPGARRRGD